MRRDLDRELAEGLASIEAQLGKRSADFLRKAVDGLDGPRALDVVRTALALELNAGDPAIVMTLVAGHLGRMAEMAERSVSGPLTDLPVRMALAAEDVSANLAQRVRQSAEEGSSEALDKWRETMKAESAAAAKRGAESVKKAILSADAERLSADPMRVWKIVGAAVVGLAVSAGAYMVGVNEGMSREEARHQSARAAELEKIHAEYREKYLEMGYTMQKLADRVRGEQR